MLIRFFVIRELNRYQNYNLYTLFDTYVMILINVANKSIYDYKGGKNMSITLERNGKWIELQYFLNKEVTQYLSGTLNANNFRFREVSKLKFGNSIMAKYNDVYFMIYADKTWIEITFDGYYREKMSEVIRVITKWDKFSKTEPTFYVEIEEGKGSHNYSYTVIFENGYATCGDYRRRFGDKIKITKFKSN